MTLEQVNESTGRKSRGGYLVALVVALLAAGWTVRLLVAIAKDRNGCFSVSGKVVDEQGQVVKDALLSSMTVVSPFPKTETDYDSKVTRTDAGHFTVRACDVGDFEVRASRLGIGLSETVRASKSAAPGVDWLGRKTYHVRDVVLVLRPQKPATTTSVGPKR
jgi:hypothetical protein